ncbi:MAG: AbrB/MazE/SpoVT family DNA-binding domain-containing protein [Saprospiraceae bacterium]|nr:AbrB/MazE/SpoVT family DNA-binding domain-containing protein [Saprospiraceae bacterium]
MITKITRWGNSLAVRLPNKYLKQTQFKENEDLEIVLENGLIILKPIEKLKLRMTMEELTEGMTLEGVMEQYEDWGTVGKEVID